jgi:hypothetical protein
MTSMGNPSDPFSSYLPQARDRPRTLVIHGEHWTVYERADPMLDRRASSSLIFESDGAVRRVRNYPANWRELSDEELGALRDER